VSMSNSGVRPEDRLFHLILALMSSSFGLTKDQILGSVRGYVPEGDSPASAETLERRFERDKDALRDLGIPLEVSIPAAEDSNNRFTTYRIRKGDYDLPEGVEFTPTDIALLNLSAALWQEGSLSTEARIAQMKLASFGVSISESLLGYAPVISTRDPALTSVRDAIDEGHTMTFEYLKAGDTRATLREVSPWALVSHEGRWHLYAYETASERAKTFLLRRIVSPVRVSQSPAAEAPENVTDLAVQSLEDVFQQQVATLGVTPHSDAWSVLSSRRGTDIVGETLRVHYTDLAIFADELTALGDDVVVLDPPTLVEAVVGNLTALVAHHE
jgi:proteasome accessory factor B